MCINQADNTEKSLQVQHMKYIYKQAQGVLIWMSSPGTVGDQRQITFALKRFAWGHRAGWDPRRLAHYLDNPRHTKELLDLSQGFKSAAVLIDHG